METRSFLSLQELNATKFSKLHFSGDETSYHEFVEEFVGRVHNNQLLQIQEKSGLLRDVCSQGVRAQCGVQLTSDITQYYSAVKALYQTYGEDVELEEIFISKLQKLKTVTEAMYNSGNCIEELNAIVGLANSLVTRTNTSVHPYFQKEMYGVLPRSPSNMYIASNANKNPKL